MGTRFRSWWQYIRKHWVATIIIVIVGLIVLIILGYLFRWDWTGFNNGTSQITITSPSIGNYKATVSQPSKTLWDWLQLLGVLAVPVVVGFGAIWFTTRQGKIADAENKDNQREAALQDYINKMSELLLEKNLRTSAEEDEVRKIAQLRTITILFQLDARRITYVFAFLRESGLMSNKSNSSIVSLSEAELNDVDFSQTVLYQANLSGAFFGNANFSEAFLKEANLSEAKLWQAKLWQANLTG